LSRSVTLEEIPEIPPLPEIPELPEIPLFAKVRARLAPRLARLSDWSQGARWRASATGRIVCALQQRRRMCAIMATERADTGANGSARDNT